MTPALIIGWMTQAIVVSALLAAAALVLQRIAGRALPARMIWGGALFSSLLLVLVAPLRSAPRATPETLTLVAVAVVDAGSYSVVVTTSAGSVKALALTSKALPKSPLPAPIPSSESHAFPALPLSNGNCGGAILMLVRSISCEIIGSAVVTLESVKAWPPQPITPLNGLALR